MRAFLDKHFDYERVDGDGVSEYLERWTLLRFGEGRKLYLHHFVGSDWSRDMHDHPKLFVSIGLRGGYVEETPLTHPRSRFRKRTVFRAPWIRWFPPRHIHRVRIAPAGCWTLVFVGKTRRDWGFWRNGRWIHWIAYVNLYGGESE